MLPLVEAGDLDISFAMLPVPEGPLHAVEVLRDPYVLLVPPGCALPDRLGPDDLAGLPLITFKTCRHAARVEAQLRARGIEPRIVFRSDDNGTIQGLTAAGIGFGLVPRLAMDTADPRSRVIAVDGLAHRRLGVVRHGDRHPSPAIDAYADVTREFCAGLC